MKRAMVLVVEATCNECGGTGLVGAAVTIGTSVNRVHATSGPSRPAAQVLCSCVETRPYNPPTGRPPRYR